MFSRIQLNLIAIPIPVFCDAPRIILAPCHVDGLSACDIRSRSAVYHIDIEIFRIVIILFQEQYCTIMFFTASCSCVISSICGSPN